MNNVVESLPRIFNVVVSLQSCVIQDEPGGAFRYVLTREKLFTGMKRNVDQPMDFYNSSVLYDLVVGKVGNGNRLGLSFNSPMYPAC
jgi:hypothetical protein